MLKNEDLRYSTAKVPQPNKYDTVLNIHTTKILIVDHKGDTLRKIDYEGNEKNGYWVMEDVNPFITISKDFYANGNIRSQGVGSWLGFSIGKSYNFNEEGMMTLSIDHDIGYKFNFDDVVNFCNKHKVSLVWDLMRGHNWITKKPYHQKPAWFITGYTEKNSNRALVVILDGKNGRILGKRKFQIIE